jgi:hypothetical protein
MPAAWAVQPPRTVVNRPEPPARPASAAPALPASASASASATAAAAPAAGTARPATAASAAFGPGGFRVTSPSASTAGAPAAPLGGPMADTIDTAALAAQVEQRVLARLDGWLAAELDDHVLRLVEERLQEETERRAWRRGAEVF